MKEIHQGLRKVLRSNSSQYVKKFTARRVLSKRGQSIHCSIYNFNFAFQYFHKKCPLWLNISNTWFLLAHLSSECHTLAGWLSVCLQLLVAFCFSFPLSFEWVEIHFYNGKAVSRVINVVMLYIIIKSDDIHVPC